MAPDEYSTGGGGRLKLKGSKVSDGRVEKKKKKKVKKEEKEKETGEVEGETGKETETVSRDQSREPGEPGELGDDGREQKEREGSAAKTEAERKYEEVRRKRLHDRLQREGIKTHKERVEELNKYLSRLSEHHDMPKIGPG